MKDITKCQMFAIQRKTKIQVSLLVRDNMFCQLCAVLFKSKFTQKCVNYANFNNATKQHNLSAIKMFTTFTSLHNILPRLGSLTQLG